jgi:DNA invertase Pin-like site-specific DNA recombinase
MHAILYARVSTSAQEREGTSLNSQVAACQKYAQEHKYSVIKTVSESYTGADLWDRPGINEVREIIRARKAQVLVCYAIDRLSRNPAHLLILLEEAERHGARIEFVTERMEDSPEWRLIQYVKSYAAELEREKIRERCVRGKKQRALSGKLHRSSTELYGYVRNHETNRREIVEQEAEQVRRIFSLVLEGQSLNAICNLLNSEGVPPPSAGKRTYGNGRQANWNPSTIQRIIREPAYSGRAIAWRWQKTKSGNVIERPAAEQVKLPDELCPPILPPDTWDAAGAALRTNTGTLTRNSQRFALLRGLILCGRCGRALVPEDGAYRCSSRRLIATHCGNGNVTRRKVEAWVLEKIEELLRNREELAARLVEIEENCTTTDADINSRLFETQKRLAAIERGQQRILRTIAGTDDSSLIKLAETQLRQLSVDRNRIETEIERLNVRTVESVDFATRFNHLSQYLSQFKIPTTVPEWRQVFEALGVEVSADKKKWQLSIRNLSPDPHSQRSHGANATPSIVIASRAA